MTINVWIALATLAYLIGVGWVTYVMVNSPVMKEDDDFLINQKDRTNDTRTKTSGLRKTEIRN